MGLGGAGFCTWMYFILGLGREEVMFKPSKTYSFSKSLLQETLVFRKMLTWLCAKVHSLAVMRATGCMKGHHALQGASDYILNPKP